MIILDDKLIEKICDSDLLGVEEFLFLYSKWKELGWEDCITIHPESESLYKYLEKDWVNTDLYVHEVSVINEEGIKLLKSILLSDFQAFWEAFPASDYHGSWKKTRGLRGSLNGSYEKYQKLISLGESHEDIMKGLNNEVEWRRTNSILKNQMTYMKNSQTWLHNMEYRNWLDKEINNGRDDKTTVL